MPWKDREITTDDGGYQNIREVTPAGSCLMASCPGVHPKKGDDNVYLLVGRKLSVEEIQEAGLAGKVAPSEVVMEVPRRIIDERRK